MRADNNIVMELLMIPFRDVVSEILSRPETMPASCNKSHRDDGNITRARSLTKLYRNIDRQCTQMAKVPLTVVSKTGCSNNNCAFLSQFFTINRKLDSDNSVCLKYF